MPETCCTSVVASLLGAMLGYSVGGTAKSRDVGARQRCNSFTASTSLRKNSILSSSDGRGGEILELPRQASSSLDVESRRKVYGLGGFCKYNKVLMCMVGLPARGKSYITAMISRYLRWTGFPVRAFNAGNLRRQEGKAGIDASFFGSDQKNQKAREEIATLCMEEAFKWLLEQDDVSVAIFDATNTTKRRRKVIQERCAALCGITALFVESICDDPEVLEQNYRMKLGNDDYRDMDPQEARADFLKRVELYEQRYESIDDDEDDGGIRYIKVYNVGSKVVLRNCFGYAPSHIGFYLSNIHITPRRIWLARHGQTRDQQRGILGSVSNKLTPSGVVYCRSLASHIVKAKSEIEGTDGKQVLVLMGTAPVHQATWNAISGSGRYGLRETEGKAMRSIVGSARDWPAMSTSLLNELDGGDCNGMSYDQIQEEHPEVWEAREKDKLNFRYPGAGGESYVDVINRLRPVIVELERHHSSILVISHLAVQRCIMAYFTGCPAEELPNLQLDMHTLYELHPGPFGTKVVNISLGDNPELLDTLTQSMYDA
eukprot:TRINITY_DN19290_c0_g3_i1.p1 TRINITY_DN19290_c0_g3~~TRINITY_DN19290_c0_g3_i1.p1  ORF type:complete len:544 (-),score=109.25 TRINITY_DN19290_c0_g3_i1:126-1757(-)